MHIHRSTPTDNHRLRHRYSIINSCRVDATSTSSRHAKQNTLNLGHTYILYSDGDAYTYFSAHEINYNPAPFLPSIADRLKTDDYKQGEIKLNKNETTRHRWNFMQLDTMTTYTSGTRNLGIAGIRREENAIYDLSRRCDPDKVNEPHRQM